ncbi:MAG: hypothetical protein A2W91_00150 [Bacteroidetes bacterium GWF2_38_335]|nr:MAG: hypothetical protein A2W91_00150 [Bacteroidetes bacterium GWF2_38_335]OFY79732.1 MAG: hypothetical protein A2281_09745 [Bacteroidetes bacterium RIFOXYA12_FULL_38_20]HBS87562.1 hypothetical protein [Bacteroidales bacterium]
MLKKQDRNIISGLLTLLAAVILMTGCGKKDYAGEKYFAIKWKIMEAVEGGKTEPLLTSPGYIEFRKDGTGHFYFEFADDTLDSEFVYAIEYFASPWPQDEDCDENAESNGPNRITLSNLIMNNRLLWQYGAINFSIEYVKKRKKMILLYDELFNTTTPFHNFNGSLLYLVCEAD